MKARLEHKQEQDGKLLKKIENMPEFMKVYYYSLHNKTHTTKKTYLNNVIRFLNHISNSNIESIDTAKLDEIKSYDISAYMQDIEYYSIGERTGEQKGSSKNIIYCSLSNFFNCMECEGMISNSPFKKGKIERAKVKENDITFLTPDEVKLIRDTIINVKGGKQEAYKNRDLCLFSIPVICGLRVMALSEINLEDLDFENKRIHVVEKGNIEKYVYITDDVIKNIQEWIRDRQLILSRANVSTDALFISNEKTRMNVRSIERVITKYCASAVPEKHITPHKLRSTFATNAYQTTHDVLLVASLMGHKSPDVTRRYAKVFDDNKIEAINKTADLYK